MALPVLLTLLLLLPPGGLSAAPVSCYNDRGAPVDWFYVYKLPRAVGGWQVQGQGQVQGQEGLRYLLLEKGSESWAEGETNINDTRGAVGRTVGQLYGAAQDSVAYVLYSDQSPGARSGHSSGHTKGVVLVGGARGFWLVHSTPHFPPPRQTGRYSYPETGLTHGQSFLCVTFPLERFDTIGEQLLINQPHVFDCLIPDALASLVPSLAALCRKPRPSLPQAPPPHTKPRPSLLQALPPLAPVSNRSVVLTSSGGTEFTSFAKGAAFNNDLYHAWVAPALGCPLLVQFWVHSTGVLPSDCSGGVTVLNVQRLAPGPSANFSTTLDHSKWAVSPEGGAAGGWACVGDINRNQAEERRGGGTVCLRDPRVWKAYRSAVLECQDCRGRTSTC